MSLPPLSAVGHSLGKVPEGETSLAPGTRPVPADVLRFYTEGLTRIRYPDPAVKVNDTVKIDLATGKITDFIHFDTGVIATITGGRNMVSSGRTGRIDVH